MILFQPTYTLKKIAQIDFEALGSAFNQLFLEVSGYEKHRVIKLGVTRTVSYAYLDENKITIARLACVHKPQFFEHLVHEFRHWIQKNHFKIKVNTEEKNYDKYYNSPEEKDARKFEQITKLTEQLYDTIVEMKRLINGKELWYYEQ